MKLCAGKFRDTILAEESQGLEARRNPRKDGDEGSGCSATIF
jgi:hypothetical protein